MPRKLIHWFSFILALGVVSSASADLVAHWKLDDVSGTTAIDSSGNNYHGILIGGPQWISGKINGALNFSGGGYVAIQDMYYDGTGLKEVSVCAWIRTNSESDQFIASFDRSEYWRLEINGNGGGPGQIGWDVATSSGVVDHGSSTRVDDGQWHHVCGVFDNGRLGIYIDGEPEPLITGGRTFGTGNIRFGFICANSEATTFNGDRGGAAPVFGDIDDLHIYDNALIQKEIKQAMRGVTTPPALASNPNPVDEATDVPRDMVLSWMPGEHAPAINGHKLYFGENFTDVNEGIGGISQDANSYVPPQLLDYGKIYYWRVNEVNGPPDFTVYPGEVWRFTTEPFAYPFIGENIATTASSLSKTNEGPENTINGSGLDKDDLHSVETGDMWLSNIAGPQPTWIQYEFDRVYRLHQILIWNHNTSVEAVLGFGIKDATIEYSVDRADWTTLGTYEFAQAPGVGDYAHNTTVNLSGVAAKYVKITAITNWGGIFNQYGLSEVCFLFVPIRARQPNPASGTTDMDVDNVALSWRGGREAASHEVYLSDSNHAVIDGTALVATVSGASYDTGELDLGQTYYWKVNEVNEAETPIVWQGDLWNFTTCDFLVVDDFESYNDLDLDDPESNRIFNTWIDGYEQATNGSVVGYPAAPFAERSIVHSGDQSMPLVYENTGAATYSEAECTFDVGQNWTRAGVATFVLYFCGTEGNTGQLYVKIDGSKVVYDSDAGDIAKVQWKQWNIDLASVGTNLQSVTKLSIGIDGTGASGTLYIDDIRLFRSAPQPEAP